MLDHASIYLSALCPLVWEQMLEKRCPRTNTLEHMTRNTCPVANVREQTFRNKCSGIVWPKVELSLLQTSSSYSRSVELANSCWIMHLYISLLYVHLAWYYCETLRNFCRNLRTRPEQNLLEQ